MTTPSDTITYSIKYTATETHTISKETLRQTLWDKACRGETDDGEVYTKDEPLMGTKRFNRKFEQLWKRLQGRSSTVFHKYDHGHQDWPDQKPRDEHYSNSYRTTIDNDLFFQL